MDDFDIFWDCVKLPMGKIEAEENTAMEKINKGECLEVFNLPFFKGFKQFVTSSKDKALQENLHVYTECEAKLCNTKEKQVEVIVAGVAPLILFIQKNWTGPDISLNDAVFPVSGFESRSGVLKELEIDGESVVSIVELPELLLLSKIILEVAYSNFNNSQVAKIWFLRCLFIHQQILEELSPKLFEKITIIIDEIRSMLSTKLECTSQPLIIGLHLEFARIYMYYSHIQKSKIDVTRAAELSGIEISFTGALGKRTKFQSNDLAQLILKINCETESSEELNENVHCNFLKDVKLDDDVRLDKIKYADNECGKSPNLSGLQQAVVLGNLFQTQKSQPKDSLADEELQSFICCILDRLKVWSVGMTTLLLRSKLEANHKRTVERAMLQVEVLLDALKDEKVTLRERLKYFFVSYLSPKWEIQLTLGNILASIGSIKSALEIYLNLEEWESVIFCYNTLQMRHKAQEIIERELEKNPSPKLWCLLGDATDDVTHYEKAWELSNKRSARAQRHWALFHYYRKNYAESIEHFQKSLEINSLQQELWYRLGYAALLEEKWEISAHAYRRYCVLDPECFEAWNNLGRCYCELKQKHRAWRALQEALKVDYSKWKVWDNYMLVSADLKMFDEVIKSYHEVLNLKEKHLDLPVLNSLVVGFKDVKDQNKTENLESRSKFQTKLLELFGRLTGQIFNDPELWFLYSEVVDADSPESLTKKQQLLMKAHRSATNKVDWEKNLESSNKVIYVLSKLIEVSLLMQKPDILMSSKLAASSVLIKLKKENPDVEICENLERNLEKLNKLLEELQK